MNDTPETDAVAYHVLDANDEHPQGVRYAVDGSHVCPDFARRLERERDEALHKLEIAMAANSDVERIAKERNDAQKAFVIATDQLVQVQGELRQVREENARLREAVSKVLNFIPAPTCDQMHHTKKDRHEYGKTCPPVERVKAIIDNARKILTP